MKSLKQHISESFQTVNENDAEVNSGNNKYSFKVGDKALIAHLLTYVKSAVLVVTEVTDTSVKGYFTDDKNKTNLREFPFSQAFTTKEHFNMAKKMHYRKKSSGTIEISVTKVR